VKTLFPFPSSPPLFSIMTFLGFLPEPDAGTDVAKFAHPGPPFSLPPSSPSAPTMAFFFFSFSSLRASAGLGSAITPGLFFHVGRPLLLFGLSLKMIPSPLLSGGERRIWDFPPLSASKRALDWTGRGLPLSPLLALPLVGLYILFFPPSTRT